MRTWIAIGGLLVAGAAVAVPMLVPEPAAPELDQELLRAVAPVVHADLPVNRKVVWPGTAGGRWFCAERPVETRRDGDDVRFGLLASCSEYAHRDGKLVHGSGFSGALVVTLAASPDGYRVRDVELPPDGAGNSAALKRMFSAAGYEQVQRSAGHGPDPAPEARAAFGLPADAPVVPR
ncbi:hypothetical protein [Kibdelosporangium phytohabitans]|uniref:Uncharacterized protein n=1 Tax=Kibdelosporangium phytohabitans TaxID=860235 RepID=A0A0N9HL16_9PSEU|nr:hypothetical protein [Kibdelosporangium phytohabitans]ALG06760.1 hypothetical protein AOZ06_07310 [Kibdelosporangium phytohabitans]MBE1467992.1 hypothetical protein [Kibdelosporangium phytohabitans]